MGLFFDLLLRYLYTINCPDVVKIVRDTLSKKLWPVFYAIIWTTTQSDCVCIFSYTKLFHWLLNLTGKYKIVITYQKHNWQTVGQQQKSVAIIQKKRKQRPYSLPKKL